jgi:hypothetical protein
MAYVIETGSGAMVHMPGFMKFGLMRSKFHEVLSHITAFVDFTVK